jgi:hypothetical protein
MRETWQSIAQRFEETGIITAVEKAYVQYEFHRVWEEFQRYIPLLILHQHWKRSIWLAAFYALPAPEPVLLLPAPPHSRIHPVQSRITRIPTDAEWARMQEKWAMLRPKWAIEGDDDNE